MPVTKLGISIPKELLDEIDKVSQGLKKIEVRLLERQSRT